MKAMRREGAAAVVLLVGALAGAFFACGTDTDLEKARRGEGNDFDQQLAEMDAAFQDAISFLDDGDIETWDGPYPDEGGIADGTDQCVCTEPDAGALGAQLACGDANAALRQQLNDMRVDAARIEGLGNAARTQATTSRDGAARLVNTIIPRVRDLVTAAFNRGSITAAQRDQMMSDLTTAAGKFNDAKDKFETARTRAASAVSNAQTARSRAQEGLDALNQCPPDVATARAKAGVAGAAIRTAARATLDAGEAIDQGRAKTREGVPLLRGVLDALRP